MKIKWTTNEQKQQDKLEKYNTGLRFNSKRNVKKEQSKNKW